MKKQNITQLTLSLFTAALIMANLFSCRTKDKPVTPVEPVTPNPFGQLTVRFNNVVDAQPVKFDTIMYTNAAGNKYSVTELKYYISNFTLIAEDSSEKNFGNYKLINAADTNSCRFTLDSVKNGKYKAVRFYVGVDSARNHTGAQTADLDPINGMIWTWATGYIFFAHTGFVADTGHNKVLVYHYGTDPALATIDIPVALFQVNSNNLTLDLNFNLNSLYNAPTVVNFRGNYVHQSDTFDDIPWIATLRQNFRSAFSFVKVQ